MPIRSQDLNSIRNDIREALQSVGYKWGINFPVNTRITYSETEIRMKLEGISTSDSNGEAIVDDARTRFTTHAPSFGVDVNAFGKTFIRNGKRCKIVDIKPKAKKYPIVYTTDVDSGRFKIGANALPSEMRKGFAFKGTGSKLRY